MTNEEFERTLEERTYELRRQSITDAYGPFLGNEAIRLWIFGTEDIRNTFRKKFGYTTIEWLVHEELLHDWRCGATTGEILMKKLQGPYF